MKAVTALSAKKTWRVAILDVDGVVFKGELFIALARRRGFREYVETVRDCLLFEIGRIRLKELVRRVGRRLSGMSWRDVQETYRAMPLAAKAAETVRALRAAGMRVILLSSGVPDALVRDLASRIGADEGAGPELAVRGGVLTGEVRGDLARNDGKLRLASRIIEREGVSWRDVVVVGNDRNNIPLMRRAGMSIGFRPTNSVRRDAQYLVEEKDLSTILPYVMQSPRVSPAEKRREARRLWHHEVLRKMVHMTGLAAVFLAHYFPAEISALLVLALAVYFVSESSRVNSVSIPFVHRVGRLLLRRGEQRRVAMGPATLAMGILLALSCLPHRIALPCILIVVVADALAGVVGSRWGRARLPYNRSKTLEGFATFLVSAVICASIYFPIHDALLLGLVSALVESLPLGDWDNLVTPVGTGLIAAMIL